MATGTVLSIARVALAAYPAFLDAAELLRNRVAFTVCLIICLIMQFFLIDMYVNWWFLG
jgi:hypothetical protein